MLFLYTIRLMKVLSSHGWLANWQLLFTCTQVYEGYLDSNLNTDNAWIEAHCIGLFVSDELGQAINNVGDSQEFPNLKWIEMSGRVESIQQDQNLRKILRQLALRFNCHFWISTTIHFVCFTCCCVCENFTAAPYGPVFTTSTSRLQIRHPIYTCLKRYFQMLS